MAKIGQLAIAVIENELEKLIMANVYVPCDPVVAFGFKESVYDKLYDVMDRHADAFLIMGGGDFNACFNAEQDSINRHKSINDTKLTDYIKTNKELMCCCW